MADVETIHRIIERLDVQNAQKVIKDIGQVANVSDLAAKDLSKLKRAISIVDAEKNKELRAEKIRLRDLEKLRKKKEFEEKQHREKEKAMLKERQEHAGEMAKGLATRTLGAIGLGFSIAEFARKAWEANTALDEMTDRLTGVAMAETRLGEIKDPLERFHRGETLARAQIEKYKTWAVELAMPWERMAEISQHVTPLFLGTKMPVADMMKMTKGLAATAQVFKVGPEEIMKKVDMLVRTGKVRGGGFGLTLMAEAGIKRTDTWETKLKKIEHALERLGRPAELLTQKAEDNLQRWKTLSEDVLERMTAPAYEQISEALQDSVKWTQAHREAIDDAATSAGKFLGVEFKILRYAAETGFSFLEWGADFLAGGIVDAAWTLFNALEWIGKQADKIFDTFAHWADAIKGAVKESSAFKWVDKQLDKAKRFVGLEKPENWRPEWEYLEESKKKQKELEFEQSGYGLSTSDKLSRMVDKFTSSKDVVGPMIPEKTRREREQEEMFKTLFGKNPLINIQSVTIVQNFREGDADDVAYQIVNSFERLSEAAVQSLAGGNATAFGPGATYGR